MNNRKKERSHKILYFQGVKDNIPSLDKYILSNYRAPATMSDVRNPMVRKTGICSHPHRVYNPVCRV